MTSSSNTATYEKLLRWLLRVMALSICCALFPIFMPLSWMQSLHQYLGLGQAPDGGIFEYLARSTSAMYFAHGVLILIVSFDVRRYRPLIYGIAAINAFLGGTLLVIDLWSAMPIYWTLLEGPMILFGAGLLMWLLRLTHTESPT